MCCAVMVVSVLWWSLYCGGSVFAVLWRCLCFGGVVFCFQSSMWDVFYFIPSTLIVLYSLSLCIFFVCVSVL